MSTAGRRRFEGQRRDYFPKRYLPTLYFPRLAGADSLTTSVQRFTSAAR